MFMDRRMSFAAVVTVAAVAGMSAVKSHAQVGFVATVTSTHPIAYYRLDKPAGKSQVGTTTYKSLGGVSIVTPGAPIGVAKNHSVQLNGHDGQVITTQVGGIETAASIMAWVNLGTLPSQEGRIFYVAGESQSGNDLDLQIETDNTLRFFTAGGGNVNFVPPVATLVNQWHLIVATVDTESLVRAIYWDGKQVATDKGGGRAGKTSVFTIGESTVFTGRFFKGAIEDAALWDRALKASEVAAIYGAATPTGSAAARNSAASDASAPVAGKRPFATTAQVDAEDANVLSN
jgi:hypothetical protein